MPEAPNKLVRTIVPLVLLALAAVLAIAIIRRGPTTPPTPNPAATTPAPQSSPADPTPTPPSVAGAIEAPTSPPSNSPPATTTNPTAQPPSPPAEAASLLQGLAARPTASPQTFSTLGRLDAASGQHFEVKFSPIGAGIASLTLADHYDTVKRETHTVIQQEHVFPAIEPSEAATPFALRDLEINGQRVSLSGMRYFGDRPIERIPCWRETAPGEFEAFVVNAQGQEIVRVVRRYTLQPGTHGLRLEQFAENKTSQPLAIRWMQFGPVDLPQDSKSYGGDKRRIRYGYLLSPQAQGGDPTVLSEDYLWWRADLLGPLDGAGLASRVIPSKLAADGRTNVSVAGWPNERGVKNGYRLAWAALTNRYFGVAVHPIVAENAGPAEKLLNIESIDRFWVPTGEPKDPMAVVLRMISPTTTVQPAQRASHTYSIYAGPLSRAEILQDAQAKTMGLDGLVRYNFGGPCGFCTFPWLTGLLLALLRVLHDYILFDWALAIMALVLIVRTILHPVTKWSQIRMQRFGKQMQSMAPKMKIIQEKYKGEPLKLREESAKLWREEGVNPAGMLGCIPMFLQTPVWIALYAMLYFAVELRHEPAFFGLFQAIAPGYPSFLGWFLGDLAEPDRFINFGHVLFNAPLLGPIESLNILPLLLGVVFFIQQKYLTPPTAPGTLSPEQEQTQFMMKIMMVIMFPLFMYNAPSGLALYFLTNSTLSILESRYIRSHIEKYDLSNPKKGGGAGGPKSDGFFARLMAKAEERKKQYEEMQKRMQKQANRKR